MLTITEISKKGKDPLERIRLFKENGYLSEEEAIKLERRFRLLELEKGKVRNG